MLYARLRCKRRRHEFASPHIAAMHFFDDSTHMPRRRAYDDDMTMRFDDMHIRHTRSPPAQRDAAAPRTLATRVFTM